ncbi:6-carboxyhexanoate--CoA ligase [bioreactor metagenome]|uniref:6-carboxyhexanoate--CoA ligase n=1 Tax=bioreactor metagenome TaxID=1076179 RepID=A0A644SVM6_9ZZZZ|nr:6-carboxyhexanoate--CoA ligase [Negativicutes bacterium]
MLYSVRMRAAADATHENGGRHISGAERLVSFDEITPTAAAMLARAFTHSRGQADFININIEAIHQQAIIKVPLLPVITENKPTVSTGRAAALTALRKAGITPRAAKRGMAELLALPDSMRGAILLCAETGVRLDSNAQRGIRVSRMDIADETGFIHWLTKQGFTNIHVREALVLAAKVASCPGILAELCWSDDPEYTAGYVASKTVYIRFPHLKSVGDPIGGRILFVEPNSDIEKLISYLESKPVLVTVPSGGENY